MRRELEDVARLTVELTADCSQRVKANPFHLASFQKQVRPRRLFACTTRGKKAYHQIAYRPGDALVFGPETRGLPQALLETLPPEQWLRIPMRPGNRSLNLANAAAVILYEAWRQQGYSGGR